MDHSRSTQALLYGASLAVLFFLMVPLLILLPLSLTAGQYLQFPPPGYSLQWYRAIFHDAGWLDSIEVSFKIAILATMFTMGLAIPASLALVRRDFPLKRYVYVFLLSPIVVPSIILAISMYLFFVKIGFSKGFLPIVVGHTVIALPVAIIILTATIQGMDPRLEQAALSLGASPLRAFFRITLPLVFPGIASASLFAFLTSFDELLVALLLSNVDMETLPVRMWNSMTLSVDPAVTAVSSGLVVVAAVVLTGATLLKRSGGART